MPGGIRGGSRSGSPAVPGKSSPGGSQSPTFFHAYDVRGQYPSELDSAAARALGRAIAGTFPGPTLLGWDTRADSLPFARGIELGLSLGGNPVSRLGIVPTPLVAYAAARWKVWGLCATASHNPLGYVGLKGFDPSGRILGKDWERVRRRFGK
ncbi:phosphomannomutase, partial [mine drainage metagenome]